MVTTATFEWLQELFSTFCDGEWERNYGIDIKTAGNPGWHVSINVKSTPFENIKVDEVKIERSERDWVMVGIKDEKLFGSGGPSNLAEIMERLKTVLISNNDVLSA
jgi:hypothetical protein